MTIFAGGSLPVSGITWAGRQLSVALCATAVTAYNTMAATDSRDVPFKLVSFRFAMFFPPMQRLVSSSESKQESLRIEALPLPYK